MILCESLRLCARYRFSRQITDFAQRRKANAKSEKVVTRFVQHKFCITTSQSYTYKIKVQSLAYKVQQTTDNRQEDGYTLARRNFL
jgi:hypothetical protein